jgi:hypothetical protein
MKFGDGVNRCSGIIAPRKDGGTYVDFQDPIIENVGPGSVFDFV